MLDKNDFASPKAVGCVGFKLQPSRTLRFVLLKCACDKHSLAIAFFFLSGSFGSSGDKEDIISRGQGGEGGRFQRELNGLCFTQDKYTYPMLQ